MIPFFRLKTYAFGRSLAFWALLAIPTSAGSTNNAALWRPRFATPAIVALDSLKDREFGAELRLPPSATHWSVTVSNDLKSWSCDVLSAVYSSVNRGSEPGWQLKIRVPLDISPELFTVIVASSEAVSLQPQALSVVPSFASDFYILHIADEQIVNERHTGPSGQYYKMVGTWEEMKWMQEPVNLINPRFVLITGDQIDYNGALDAWNNWFNWGYKPGGKRTFSREETIEIENRLSALYRDCHAGYRVPYVETPGNHDVAPVGKLLAGSDIDWHAVSVPIYESYFGQRSWSFRMGDFYVLVHDWSDSSLKSWAADEYGTALRDHTIAFRLLGQHYTNDQAFMPQNCDLMLVGHGHVTTNLQLKPYCVYEEGPAFKYGTSGFYNFRGSPNGWTCDQTSTPRDPAKDVWPLFTANGETKKVRADQPDPMKVTAEEVTITNDLPGNFYDGRVRFVLPRGKYRARNGVILSEYDCDDGSHTAVLVKVNIPPNAAVTVQLAAN